jgi:hypothetical protein
MTFLLSAEQFWILFAPYGQGALMQIKTAARNGEACFINALRL